MKEFLAYVLLHYGFVLIAGKYNLKGIIQTVAEKTKTKLIYDLSECEFCIGHLVGALFLLPFVLVRGFEWVHLVYPLMSISLIFMVKRDL